MLKRLISSALALSLVFGGAAALPEGALELDAALCASAESWGDYEYNQGYSSVEITGYNGKDTSLKIPSQINGSPVTSIGIEAFSSSNCPNNKNIIAVDIPESVKVISSQAFYECSNLKYVNLPSNNIRINDKAFYGTQFMSDLLDESDKVILNGILMFDENASGDYVVPDGVVNIVGGALKKKNITSLVIPSSVKIIGDHAFDECKLLKSVTIKDGATDIGGYCFRGCENLQTITLPNTLKDLGPCAFADCVNLKKITIPNGTENMSTRVFENTGLTDLVIPEGVVMLYTLWNCNTLQNVTIHGDDILMSTNDFDGCTSLKTIRFTGEYPRLRNNSGYSTEDLDKSIKIYAHANSGAIDYAKKNGNPYEASDYISGSSYITYYTEKTDIIIPETYNNTKVVAVSGIYGDNLKSITIPKNIDVYSIEYLSSFSDNLTPVIYCYANSPALEFAKKKNYKYEIIPEPHTHSYASKITKAATCTTDGIKTYTCSCGDSYTETVKATGHKYTAKVVKPTYTSQGYTLHTCSCGDSYKDNYKAKLTRTSIAKAKVSGLKSKYYTGKAITQKPVVKLGTKTLKAGTDYTVSYKNNKAIGTATVTIKGKGKYSGSVKATFKICPKKTAVKKLTSPKTKQLKVTYNKVAGVTGYQVTYSTSSKFTKKTTKSASSTGTSKTIKKLTKGKTYYVKVRTYKTVNGTKYYSGYTAVKKIKVK